MRIFLSYASEDKDIAEQICLALLPTKNTVFFDRKDLEGGGDYNSQIRTAVNVSDLMIFLVSPNSVEQGSYALTELKCGSEKWPNPVGNVLPVMIRPTEYELIPNYLKAVTILEPRGNVAAEVAFEVTRQSSLPALVKIMIIVFLVSALGGIGLLLSSSNSKRSTEPLPQKENFADELAPFYAKFHGDLSFLYELENPQEKLTVSNQNSGGLVLSPGIDLGYQEWSQVQKIYGSYLSPKELEAIKKVIRLRGKEAIDALTSDPVLKSITIPEKKSREIWPYAVRTYWEAIAKRFPALLHDDTPCSIQTVLLSLAYNRGKNNRELEMLRQPIANQEWKKIADIVGKMQQNHELAYVKERRQAEAKFIRKELETSWWPPWGQQKQSCGAYHEVYGWNG